MNIAKVTAREIFDSRGWPTVECEITLSDGTTVSGSVPAGLSKGSHEAQELRDGNSRLRGKGVSRAVENIENIIAPILIGKEPDVVSMDLAMIELDGTPNKAKLGANATLAVSAAIFRAQAAMGQMRDFELAAYLCDYNSVSIPFPMFNVINGGMHAPTKFPVQEILIIPLGSQSFRMCMEAALTAFYNLYEVLKKHKKRMCIGDEGGFACDFTSLEQALDMLMEAIERTQKERSERFVIGLDIAASTLYEPRKKVYNWQGQKVTSDDMIGHYVSLASRYPIYSIEDGLDQDDFDGWVAMTALLKDKVNLVGDDLFATNPSRIVHGIETGAATSVIIKPNQIGTVTETLQAIKLCKEYEMGVIVSHRSGETSDPLIVDLAVGTSAGYIKAGGCTRGESMDKYNELLRIEDFLMLSLLNG